nr:MAG TPA: hypothetical protein [Caudoviricetes sp.]
MIRTGKAGLRNERHRKRKDLMCHGKAEKRVALEKPREA